ncbi:hypothetical protein [Salinicoccus luteus]|uniref:hypothetical protein n=1 Tax=Salinicoccus luteus TaxID=367840 RepID=UPI000A5F5B83|nr:hypothetical protein [Salinicoccus luteus]
MKDFISRNDAFFSFSVYFILLYLVALYYHYHNKMFMILEIQSNFIEIYQMRIQGLID